MKIYDFVEKTDPASRVSSATVEIFDGSKWVTVLDGQPLLAHDNRMSDSIGKYTPIQLNGASAERIRMTLKNTLNELGVTIYEITLDG